MSTQTTNPFPRPLRSDAASNRQHILDTAREVFLESGVQTPVSTIARRAGVGTATVYRRFPTRQDLIKAVFVGEVNSCIDLVVQAAEDPDPWRGFTAVIKKLLDLDTANRGFIRAFLISQPHPITLEEGTRRAEEAFAKLMHRAKDVGALRSDFTRSDLDLALTANAGLHLMDPDNRPAASHRFAALMLDAFAGPSSLSRTCAPEDDPRPNSRTR